MIRITVEEILHPFGFVVFPTCILCAYSIIGGLDGLESLLGGFITRISVRMILSCEFPLHTLYFRIRGIPADAENLVGVLRHGIYLDLFIS